MDKNNVKYFGPKLFDENNLSYNKRLIKKGFIWGFLLSSSVFYQYSLYSFLT